MESVKDQSDVLAVSGDIGESHDIAGYLQEMEEIVQKPTYFVLGNHDFYRGSIVETRREVTHSSWISDCSRHCTSAKDKSSNSLATLRMFDSFVNVSSHAGMEHGHHPEKAKADHPHENAHRVHEKHQPDHAKKPRLPDPAASFAGMIRGKVVAKYDSGDFALDVAHVMDEWQHSKAENAESLIGKTVLVSGRKEHGEPVAKFMRSLKIGEMITIDVAHPGKGEALTILELTEDQRQRIK